MYDDFWAGYNYGNQPIGGRPANVSSKDLTRYRTIPAEKQVAIAGMYDKSKLIKMKGPNGEDGEIYANGKMYIIFPDGKSQVRTFPSRPWGIRYMQKRGWVLA